MYTDFSYNDADLNWETFNSPRFWGNFRSNNHESAYAGLKINMTCHERLDFPTKTLKGNECLNWQKYIYTNVINQWGFMVQHLRDEVNLKARVSHYFRFYNLKIFLNGINSRDKNLRGGFTFDPVKMNQKAEQKQIAS